MKDFILYVKRKSSAIPSGVVDKFNGKKKFNFDIQRFDHFHNTVSGVIISGTDSDDYIYNGKSNDSSIGSNVKINALGGNDSIKNYYGENVTISGGEGNDSISNSGDSVTISGGEGNDSISNSGDSVTISGAKVLIGFPILAIA